MTLVKHSKDIPDVAAKDSRDDKRFAIAIIIFVVMIFLWMFLAPLFEESIPQGNSSPPIIKTK